MKLETVEAWEKDRVSRIARTGSDVPEGRRLETIAFRAGATRCAAWFPCSTKLGAIWWRQCKLPSGPLRMWCHVHPNGERRGKRKERKADGKAKAGTAAGADGDAARRQAGLS